MLHDGKRSTLTFPMIGRLAELLLRVNETARHAHALTYSHVFMDEFQDTTQVQYDLIQTLFLGTDTVVTAVGDNKQQIMLWAMAMEAPFDVFEADFGAKRIHEGNGRKLALHEMPQSISIRDCFAALSDIGIKRLLPDTCQNRSLKAFICVKAWRSLPRKTRRTRPRQPELLSLRPAPLTLAP
jgi:hypothetical protein